MELLEQITPRRVALIAFILFGLKFLFPYYHIPLNYYRQNAYPPMGGTPEAGKEILAANEKKEAAAVAARYRRVLARLEQARAEGHDTTGLEAKARAALSLNVDAYRRKAVKMLTEVEMAAPRRRVQYIPMGPTEAPGEEIEDDIPAKAITSPAEDPEPSPKQPERAKKKRTRRGRAQ